LNKSLSLRARLLGTSAIAAAGSFLFGMGSPSPALASCSGLPPTSGGNIVCSGYSYYSLQTNADSLTVTLNPSAELSYAYDPTIVLGGDDNRLTIGDQARVFNYGAEFAVGVYGDGSSVTLNGGEITLHGYTGGGGSGKYTSMLLGGDDSHLTLNGASTINVIGDASSGSTKYTGLATYGAGQTVTLNGGSSVNVTGMGDGGNKYVGMLALDASSSASEALRVTLNGGSSINVSGSGGGNKYMGVMAFAYGCGCSSYAPQITLNGGSSINLAGSGGSGKYLGAVLVGSHGDITLNDSSIVLHGVGSTGYYGGVELFGDSNVVTLNGSSKIEVGGPGTIFAVGLAASGSYNSVTLNDTSSITVYGAGSGSAGIGIADGYASSVTLNGNASVTTYGAPAVYIDDTSYASVTLNDNAALRAYGGSGIAASDSDHLAITLNGNSTVGGTYRGIDLYNVEYSSVSIGQGTSVYGNTGIRDDGIFNSFFVAGTVTGIGGTAIDLSNAGNDTLTLGTGATINGDIRGGGGFDRLFLEGHGTLSSAISDFDQLTVDADGVWDLDTNLDLDGGAVTINSGTLAVNGFLDAGTITVAAGGTLGGSGTVEGDVVNNGTVSPGNSPGTLNIVGNFTFGPASTLIVEADATAHDLLTATGNVTINGGTVTPVFLAGVDGFSGDIIQAANVILAPGFSSVGNNVALSFTGTTVSLTAISPSSVNGSVSGGAATGFTFLDAVLGQAQGGIGRGKGLWGTGLWQSADRSADGMARGFSQRSQGGAIGGDILQSGNFTLGVAAGYVDSSVDTDGGGSKTEIDGYNAALYGSYGMGGTFATAALTAAWQDQDVRRNVLSGGALATANGSPEAWLGGAGFALGHVISIQGPWTLTPKASLAWQHVSRDGYTETGGGLAAMSIDKVSGDTVRGLVGAELGLAVHAPDASWTVRPAIRAGLAQEWRSGDTSVNGTFTSGGAPFTATLDTRDQTYMAVGAGVDITLGHGLTAFASYDGGFGGDVEKTGGVRVGARLEW
jgi:uncharacterized protein with beta-barrel porin domain